MVGMRKSTRDSTQKNTFSKFPWRNWDIRVRMTSTRSTRYTAVTTPFRCRAA